MVAKQEGGGKGKRKIQEDVCQLCHSTESSLSSDTIFQTAELRVHYFCLLFSSGLGQSGEDHEGIRGFLAADIRKELRRGARLRCVHCRKLGATVGCAVDKCPRSYHLPCGSRNAALNQYFGEYRSYCKQHRPRQSGNRANSSKGNSKLCSICQEATVGKDGPELLWCACCWSTFDRECVQRLAMSAGSHHFRCPNCNDMETFTNDMKTHGIYIPEQDASWEADNQFEDLDGGRVPICHAKRCGCPHSDPRLHHSTGGLWEILMCQACGSRGVHVKCANLQDKAEPEWWCHNCRGVLAPQPQHRSPPQQHRFQRSAAENVQQQQQPQQPNKMFAALLSVSLSHLQSLEALPQAADVPAVSAQAAKSTASSVQAADAAACSVEAATGKSTAGFVQAADVAAVAPGTTRTQVAEPINATSSVKIKEELVSLVDPPSGEIYYHSSLASATGHNTPSTGSSSARKKAGKVGGCREAEKRQPGLSEPAANVGDPSEAAASPLDLSAATSAAAAAGVAGSWSQKPRLPDTAVSTSPRPTRVYTNETSLEDIIRPLLMEPDHVVESIRPDFLKPGGVLGRQGASSRWTSDSVDGSNRTVVANGQTKITNFYQQHKA